ncbi:MAG TPA: hypothetical protein VFE58_08795 [Tepidisphaeraceae bacterium]|jgi:hypothetical protein|nr:hypothetical protein [Tepidisphaeraceae bacterium]
MNENDLGKALLRGEDPINLQLLTDRVLLRDRRRMWIGGTACIMAWVLAVMFAWATILPMLKKVSDLMMEIAQNSNLPPAVQHQQAISMMQAIRGGTIATFIGSIASTFVAALFTVSFIILSRRATLRQLNARLAEISTQLKTMASASK